MAETVRIVVRGNMSERFCRGLTGRRRAAGAGVTVLEVDATERSVAEVLASLGNLGLEVVRVEGVVGRPAPEED